MVFSFFNSVSGFDLVLVWCWSGVGLKLGLSSDGWAMGGQGVLRWVYMRLYDFCLCKVGKRASGTGC